MQKYIKSANSNNIWENLFSLWPQHFYCNDEQNIHHVYLFFRGVKKNMVLPMHFMPLVS